MLVRAHPIIEELIVRVWSWLPLEMVAPHHPHTRALTCTRACRGTTEYPPGLSRSSDSAIERDDMPVKANGDGAKWETELSGTGLSGMMLSGKRS